MNIGSTTDFLSKVLLSVDICVLKTESVALSEFHWHDRRRPDDSRVGFFAVKHKANVGNGENHQW